MSIPKPIEQLAKDSLNQSDWTEKSWQQEVKQPAAGQASVKTLTLAGRTTIQLASWRNETSNGFEWVLKRAIFKVALSFLAIINAFEIVFFALYGSASFFLSKSATAENDKTRYREFAKTCFSRAISGLKFELLLPLFYARNLFYKELDFKKMCFEIELLTAPKKEESSEMSEAQPPKTKNTVWIGNPVEKQLIETPTDKEDDNQSTKDDTMCPSSTTNSSTFGDTGFDLVQSKEENDQGLVSEGGFNYNEDGVTEAIQTTSITRASQPSQERPKTVKEKVHFIFSLIHPNLFNAEKEELLPFTATKILKKAIIWRNSATKTKDHLIRRTALFALQVLVVVPLVFETLFRIAITILCTVYSKISDEELVRGKNGFEFDKDSSAAGAIANATIALNGIFTLLFAPLHNAENIYLSKFRLGSCWDNKQWSFKEWEAMNPGLPEQKMAK